MVGKFRKIKNTIKYLLEILGIYRSENGYVAGVFRGLADRFNWNVNLLRFLALVSVFLSFGFTIIVYLLAIILIPLKVNGSKEKYINRNNKVDDYVDVDAREL